MFDIVGDIHGHAKELRALLDKMGYVERDGCYRHESRQVIFVGDFIDRGPEIDETLAIAKAMHDQGAALAVMGNHEYNALAFHTADPNRSGQHLRSHSDKNLKQIGETLRQLSAADLKMYLDWFRSLPMYLDLDQVRVVHASWNDEQIELLRLKRESHGGVTDSFLVEASDLSTELFQAIDDVLKGKDIPLPEGMYYLDKEGHPRKKMRIKWYRAPAQETYQSYAFSDGVGLPDSVVPNELVNSILPYDETEKPVVVGHYWLQADVPTRLSSNVACVDYSIAKQGKLVAYRWSGETELEDENFCFVNYLSR